MLKKTTIAVLGLLASGYAAAGTMGPVCTPGNVTVPCEARKWELGADALYMQPIYSAHKSLQLVPNGTTATVSSEVADVRDDWSWGFRVMGSFYFNTGNDITVNWTHLDSKADFNNIFAPLAIPSVGFVQVPANYESRDHFDQANIVLGQHVDVSARKQMRFFGGMQYANIQSNATNYLNAPLIPVLFGSTVSVFNNTDFKGIGPVAGIDYSYALFNGLSVTANGTGSILVGTSRYHEGFVVDNAHAILLDVYARNKAIVPSLEAKLGLNYAHAFWEGTLNIDAGYQALNYFNALAAQEFQSPTAPVRTVNYGLFGPYFGLKYVGNA
ncbi:Lpg1974 family pore-forming outer membrane protein [Legionella lytica]|uniref:Lpg1974 family pore-forming outer membrane protein n=1 Tax=Legionella lytica TaxID=96232 RepID=A0ABW8D7Q8_9GAMM